VVDVGDDSDVANTWVQIKNSLAINALQFGRPVPRGLKPAFFAGPNGTAEAVPYPFVEKSEFFSRLRAVPTQNLFMKPALLLLYYDGEIWRVKATSGLGRPSGTSIISFTFPSAEALG
jgi:hypothetical protein